MMEGHGGLFKAIVVVAVPPSGTLYVLSAEPQPSVNEVLSCRA
jgi:hypothetical protein